MVFAHHVPDDPRRLHIGPVVGVVLFIHAEQNTPVYGLEAVARIRQGATDDHAHGVVEVGFPKFVLDGDGADCAPPAVIGRCVGLVGQGRNLSGGIDTERVAVCYHYSRRDATRAPPGPLTGDVTMRTLLIAAAFSALALPGMAASLPVNVAITGAAGQVHGSAQLTEGPRGLLLRLEVKGLSPGWHGLHFHETGDCSSPDFKSAGAHLHGGGTSVHGLLNSTANEAGDLPNLFVAADGTGRAEFFSAWTSLGADPARQSLADANGGAIVIHASPDDHLSQPIGGAGARLACGVIPPQ